MDFQRLFETAPDLYLVLSPDLYILGASNAYLSATLTQRDEIVARHLFEVFPDNPMDLTSGGVTNLRASLDLVLKNKQPHVMPIQKYDIRRPDGVFEERFWSPLNTPVMGDDNEVLYIIHRVEDVTGHERLKKDAEQQKLRKAELEASEIEHIQNIKDNEERFNKILDLVPITVYITTAADGRLLYANKTFEQLFLIKSANAIGKTVIELGLTNEQNRQEVVNKIREKGGKAEELEVDLNAGGELRRMLLSIETIEINHQSCFIVALVDISERRKMEDRLLQTNHFLDTILDNIPDMVFVKDARDLKFIRFNKAGEQILGYSREALIGKNDYDFFPKEQAAFFTQKDKEVFAGKMLVDIAEEPIRTRSGERWLHTKKIPVFEHGVPVFLLGISEDITERKKQHDALHQLNKELEAFSYSVSHDLRAPLRAVSGYAQILNEDYAEIIGDEGRRLLKVISANAERMGVLIDELLRFSRLGRKELRLSETNMTQLVENTIAEINKVTAHNAEIVVNGLHNIQADPTLMKQVMMNLLDNAVKYSAQKEKPRVEIRSWRDGEKVLFSVKDNGAGFDMRYADKLFGVFQRLHSFDEFEGTGVGLAIVQRIVNRHKGNVWAEAKEHEGATFFFSIPSEDD